MEEPEVDLLSDPEGGIQDDEGTWPTISIQICDRPVEVLIDSGSDICTSSEQNPYFTCNPWIPQLNCDIIFGSNWLYKHQAQLDYQNSKLNLTVKGECLSTHLSFWHDAQRMSINSCEKYEGSFIEEQDEYFVGTHLVKREDEAGNSAATAENRYRIVDIKNAAKTRTWMTRVKLPSQIF
nr:unnamed protein product [Callosobruchus chinensis]